MNTSILIAVIIFIIYRMIKFSKKEKKVIIMFNELDLKSSNKPDPVNPEIKKFKFLIYYKNCQFSGVYHNDKHLSDENLKPFVLHYEIAKKRVFIDEFDCFYQFQYDFSNNKADFYFDVITNTPNPLAHIV